MADPQVILLNDLDIFPLNHVRRIIRIKESRTYKRDNLINNRYRLEVDNSTNFYSVNNPKSYFFNNRWRYGRIQIISEDNNTLWDGLIISIKRNPDRATAIIETINSLYKKWKTYIPYISSGDEDPATAAKNILDNESIEYNSQIMQTSINKLTENNCLIRCNINLDDKVTLMAALEKLGEYACSDAYNHFNQVYFKHFQKFTGGVKVTLNEDDIENFNLIDDMEKDIINNYTISYLNDDGVPATDIANDNLGEISRLDENYGVHDLPGFTKANAESQIYFVNKTSAVYIGNSYERRTHINIDDKNKIPRPPDRIRFNLPGTHREWIDLETYFNLNWPDENWINKTFEFFKSDVDYDNNTIGLEAIEVQT